MTAPIVPPQSLLAALALALAIPAQQDWRPAEAPLLTRWAAQVSADAPRPEHPRPQWTRDGWRSLDGLWQYAVEARPADGEFRTPPAWDGQILVPFCIESALSGVRRALGPDERLWYRRKFESPTLADGGELLLHFGAVDWHATVFVNGTKVGDHRGGYDPFCFEIGSLLVDGDNEVLVAVDDPTDHGSQPRGKQVLDPRGIWYTAVSGIWQTVWLEPVPPRYLRELEVIPDLDAKALRIVAHGSDEADLRVIATLGGEEVGRASGRTGHELVVSLERIAAWSPDSPTLYDLVIEVFDGDRVFDRVQSYAGLRKIEVAPDAEGVPRIWLNGEILFQLGPLDQGWWPDGLYTAPSDAALRADVETTKQLGFNMTRKHVKVEPARWYHWCDRLGLLVWQDMPSGGPGPRWVRSFDGDGPDALRPAESAQQFDHELRELVSDFGHFPSIVVWVPFNESWGQFDTERVVAELRRSDRARLVNAASGGNYAGVGDLRDAHAYPEPSCPPIDRWQAAVCGEFGGLGLPIAGHTWQDRENWGYRSYTTPERLLAAYRDTLAMCRPLIATGMAAAVYTQLTDVEIEVNGLLTYDRVPKLEVASVAAINRRLYGQPQRIETLTATARTEPLRWCYTTESPPAGWTRADFDDAAWSLGEAGFGRPGTPGAVIGTRWESGDLWIRRSFELADGDLDGEVMLLMHHDEDVKVFVNGVLAAERSGFTTDYVFVPISEAARATLRGGTQTLAAEVHQTGGGQYLDLGLVVLRSR